MILLWLGLVPRRKVDGDNLNRGLQKLTSDDPSLAVRTAADGVVMIGGVSEEQLDAAVDVLVHGFGVQVPVKRIQVAYKETLSRAADGEAKHMAQPGGHAEYAHVKLRVEPGETGSGRVIESAVAGGAIPERMIPSIDEGIGEGLDRGVLAGYPIDDVHVTVYDGSYHDLDSSEVAFRNAGLLAFRDAARKAKPILLEPMMSVSIAVPVILEPVVIGALNVRHAAVLRLSREAGLVENVRIEATAALAEMFGFGSQLRGLTSDLGRFTMVFSHYAPATLAADDGGPEAEVRSPLHPRTPMPMLRASVPEPEDERRT